MVNLKWWFIFVASLAGLLFASSVGFVYKLWEIDQTKLSFVILALYFLITPFVGWLTYIADQGEVRRPTLHLDFCEEASELFMRLAIMGTTLGFFFMLSSSFNGTAAVTAQTVAEAARGLATICLVTFVGVLASALLNLQLANLRFVLDD